MYQDEDLETVTDEPEFTDSQILLGSAVFGASIYLAQKLYKKRKLRKLQKQWEEAMGELKDELLKQLELLENPNTYPVMKLEDFHPHMFSQN